MAEDMSQYISVYTTEAEENLQNLNKSLLILEKEPGNQEAINQIFRSAHTLKGNSATMGFEKISELAHSMEDVLGRLKEHELIADSNIIDTLFSSFDMLETMIDNATKGKAEGDPAQVLAALEEIMQIDSGDSKNVEGAEGGELAENPHMLKTVKTVKVDMATLDIMLNLVGELLINKMRIEKITEGSGSKELNESIKHLGRLISELQFEVMQSRLVPVGHIFDRFPRMVRDIAKKEGKKINFSTSGDEIELDRTVIDNIGEPLIHLLRNAVDHGIEEPAARKKEGKIEEGKILLSAKRKKNVVVIEVFDDGRGIKTAEVKKVAVERGIIKQSEVDNLTEKKALDLIFDPRFSTSKKVTEFSGRGVGLDVVKNRIESLGGSVSVESIIGEGTKILIEMPLTLAIVQCFLVKVASRSYGIPLNNVIRTVRIKSDEIRTIEGIETFILNQEDIPLIRLRRLFGIEEEEILEYTALIIERDNEKVGLIVDEINDKQDVIIKPLDKSLRESQEFSGCTILGDGSVALILDLKTII